MPTEHAKEYEAAVRAGGVVVAIKAADQERADRATRILSRHQAENVASYNQAL